MDKLDENMLLELMKDSRIAVSSLAKRLKVSREVVTYRISKLKKDKVVLDFVAEINTEKLDFIGAAVFINVKAQKEKEFKKYLEECGFVSWVAELSGVWSFGMSIYGKDNEDIDKKFLLLYNKFKDDIIDHRFTLHRRSSFFYEKYFGSRYSSKKKSEKYKIDKKDKRILKELAKNSRIDSVELSQIVGLTAPAVSNRIRKLEKSGYIEKYSVFLDVSKLNLFQYSVFVTNKNIDERGKLLSYLSEHSKVSFIAEYMGDPFLEFGVIVKDPYDLRVVLQEIEESFPDNRLIEVSLFHKEFLSVGPPKCVFE